MKEKITIISNSLIPPNDNPNRLAEKRYRKIILRKRFFIHANINRTNATSENINRTLALKKDKGSNTYKAPIVYIYFFLFNKDILYLKPSNPVVKVTKFILIKTLSEQN